MEDEPAAKSIVHNVDDDLAMASAAHDDYGTSQQREQWQQEQDTLKRRLKLYDDFSWKIQPNSSCTEEFSLNKANAVAKQSFLRYVGGVDLSFCKKDSTIACGAVVIMDLDTMSVVYEDFSIVHLTLPYIPGFLAFRESPVLLGLLEKLALDQPHLYPQVLMVDGNGILHPRGFGLASHLGVLADIPTIGVAKNLHHVDGITQHEVRSSFENSEEFKDGMPLIGKSGQILGTALRSYAGCRKPIFISIGHRISLQTAVNLVQLCCKYRIPEPVRQADMRSREWIRDKFKG